MKKLILLSGMLMLGAVLGVNNLWAQGNGIGTPTGSITHFVLEDLGNGILPEPSCFQINNTCELIGMRFKVFVTNYDDYSFPSNLNPNALYQAPDIYVRYIVGDYTSPTQLLSGFTLAQGHHDNLYSTTVYLDPLSDLDICFEGPISNTNYQINLYYLENGDFYPYPVGSYTANGELFEESTFGNDVDPSNSPSVHSGTINICCDCITLPRDHQTSEEPSENFKTLQWSIQPNPFNEMLNIQYETSKNSATEIQLMAMNGQLVHHSRRTDQSGFNQININTSNLPNGIYYCKIKTVDGTSLQKVIKAD